MKFKFSYPTEIVEADSIEAAQETFFALGLASITEGFVIKAVPAKAKKTPGTPSDRNKAALRAHRTRLVAKLPGTRGKARTELKGKIANYDEQIAA